ncbi:uncharacterized protein CIMG_04058 [Coccidioides immitis RS]|uniref:Uncharacterized protein n=4 Tax=Coccidioides immitis TaxID=5501 RepID=J3KCP6_COCIM|nr:uncharacterized protein CIMG_04058 [Coccidioides immitis RS]KMP08316.1 hypothetical protein CIRG_07997 [Coccidioides immitis RMSCC 2394]KMU72426.1 hypothetical protein CISG_03074 [Coccidioides immitis RMSCC 3703]KMU88643.1 hypothetical protein CIHG_06582 [Coccidioides immitis H538.4]TPX19967.1 hypothetical protein DIZ76_017762 [Coccidioides immitis]EAS33034.3 hypothetical protein CIMG_04058 [Coccidioides immitis RS]
MTPLRKRDIHQPALQSASCPVPSKSSSTDPATDYVTSSTSAAELQSRIEAAVHKMEQAHKDLQRPRPKGFWSKLFEKIKGCLQKLFGRCAPQVCSSEPPNPCGDEQSLTAILRRRTFEGINLSLPKVQALTGDGRIPRKPSLFQEELSAELVKERQHHCRSTLGSRDYASFVLTGKLDETLDETNEPIYQGSQFNSSKPHFEELLSELSSEPSESIKRPFSIESDLQENWDSHRIPGAEPRSRRLSSFFESIRASSPLGRVGSNPKTPSSPKGEYKAVPSTSASDEGSLAFNEQ